MQCTTRSGVRRKQINKDFMTLTQAEKRKSPVSQRVGRAGARCRTNAECVNADMDEVGVPVAADTSQSLLWFVRVGGAVTDRTRQSWVT